MTREKYIVSLSNSGIANRMKCILSTLRLGRKLSRVPIIYWVSNPCAQCEFSDLYKNDIRTLSNEAELERILKEEKWRLYRSVSKRLPSAKYDYALISTWRFLTFPNEIPEKFAQELPSANAKDIDFEYHRIPQEIQREYSGLINTLLPVDYVTEQVEKLAPDFTHNTVSVHVRSWIDSKDWSKLFNIEEYFEVMDRMSGALFFVSCDSPEVLDKFVQRYGDRIFYHHKRTFAGDRNSRTGIQDALVDLYLLSKNNKILTSFPSTFSEMAWWFGGCTAEVITIGSNEEFRRSILENDRKAVISLMFKNLLYKEYLMLKGPAKNVIHYIMSRP